MLNLGKYTSDGPSLKRARDPEEAIPPAFISIPEEHGTDGSMSAAEKIKALEFSIQETAHLFALPLHTEELGRLAVYDSFDYEFPFQPNDIHYQPQSHLDPQYGSMAGPIEPGLLYGTSGAHPASAMGNKPPRDL
ncbi:hypothetical protein C8R44DRAFT_724248 [Mycena epipterygia]|nr:hypothetical protein C8R44DRAFT_724248 [Mycena epipterygia]